MFTGANALPNAFFQASTKNWAQKSKLLHHGITMRHDGPSEPPSEVPQTGAPGILGPSQAYGVAAEFLHAV